MKLYSKIRIKLMKFYYTNVVLQKYLSVCDVCHRLKWGKTVKSRKYYSLPKLGTITSKSKMCNKCNRQFVKGLGTMKKSMDK